MTRDELDVLCAQIAEVALLKRFAQETRKRNWLACGAFVRRLVGWSAADDESTRAEMRRLAAGAVESLKQGVVPDCLTLPRAEMAAAYVQRTMQTTEPWEQAEAVHKKALEKLAKRLPVWEWAAGVKGLGPDMLGQIVAEAGNLDNYPNPAKLWKRLGQAPREEYEMIKKDGTVGIAEPKQRKAVVWNAGECLIKAAGPYYQLYVAHKAKEAVQYPDDTVMPNGRKMTKGWRAARAARVMRKQMLVDLWAAWKQCAE